MRTLAHVFSALRLAQLPARRLLDRERIEDFGPCHQLVMQVWRERVAGVAALAHDLAARDVRAAGDRRRLGQVQEDHRQPLAARLVQLDVVAVALPVPVLLGHGPFERRLDRRSRRRLEVDALVAAAVAQQGRDLLVVVERRMRKPQLQLGAVGRVEARPLRIGRLVAIGAERPVALAALVADGVDDGIFARALLVQHLQEIAAPQIARHRQPPDQRTHQHLHQARTELGPDFVHDCGLERPVDLDAQPLHARLLQLLVGGRVGRLRRRGCGRHSAIFQRRRGLAVRRR